MKKILLLILMTTLSVSAFAQWKVGAMFGADRNKYEIDTQYFTNFDYQPAYGWTAGAMVSYDFNDWLGVTAELNFTDRNYNLNRGVNVNDIFTNTRNRYLLLPVMAQFSFGGKKVKGYLDLGVYGGYNVYCRRYGYQLAPLTLDVSNVSSFDEINFWNSKKDVRYDFGACGEIGVRYDINNLIGVKLGVRLYKSFVSAVKYGRVVEDRRINSTQCVNVAVLFNL